MRTTVQIKVPTFEGSFTCTVEKQEWKKFIETLQHLESSVEKHVDASWGNMEANIEFRFTLTKSGTLDTEYKFSGDNFSLGPTLSGRFEADQSFLSGWAKSAERVLENAR